VLHQQNSSEFCSQTSRWQSTFESGWIAESFP
jgi:hypothetical protein